MEMAQVGGVDGVILGKCRSNSVESSTASTFTLTTGTWYRAKIVANSDASRVDFYLYSEAGALLWTDNLTTNIPTGAGREVGHMAGAFNTGTTATPLLWVDYMYLLIARTLTR
jgi:hypothetical protein